ncbi:MAG: T9SS type A sorting domain-containing protein [Bacteroidetes bacterium]|nr:T9SS type A sorting domain-containing protein [Bacteroidota bacterium]
MKNIIKKTFFLILIAVISNKSVFSQLSGKAKMLYDSAYAQDPILVKTALTNGAKIFSTSDNNSFYLQWIPDGTTPDATPLIVSLHGSGCNAFMEFKSWYLQAKIHKCGIIAIQWYRYIPNPPLDYFTDDTLYSYIDSALANINYPSNKALLHGFSRGSARTYAMIFNDIQSGNNYFCTTISNAGDADLNYPLYDSINNGNYGATVFMNKHWNLFCGGKDTTTYCYEMKNTEKWLQSQGAIVDIFIQDAALDHNGFQLPSSYKYKDSILNNYLQCYNGTLNVFETDNKKIVSVFPNPFSFSTTLKTTLLFKNASLTVYNSLGQAVKQMDKLTGRTIILHRDNLSTGLYFVTLTQENQVIATNKIIITD